MIMHVVLCHAPAGATTLFPFSCEIFFGPSGPCREFAMRDGEGYGHTEWRSMRSREIFVFMKFCSLHERYQLVLD
jgi:hypothetical protein